MSKQMIVGFNTGFAGENKKETLDSEDYGYSDWDEVGDTEKFDIALEVCVNSGLEIFYYSEEGER